MRVGHLSDKKTERKREWEVEKERENEWEREVMNKRWTG